MEKFLRGNGFPFLVGKLCHEILNGLLATILKLYIRFSIFFFFLAAFGFAWNNLPVTQISMQSLFRNDVTDVGST